MRLVKLISNNPGFKTLEFNRSGISLLVGRSSEGSKGNTKKTYNGVGKSFSAYLIHFCLGAEKNEELTSKLPGWTFTLSFEINGVIHSTTRSTEKQDVVLFDNEELKLKDYRDRLEALTFDVPSGMQYLRFRPLISRFIRPSKHSYQSAEQFVAKEQEVVELIINGFLLGLDPSLAIKKLKLREAFVSAQKNYKALKTDPVFREFFFDDAEASVKVIELEEDVKKLQTSLSGFNVAEDYHDIRKRANRLTREIKDDENRVVSLENAIRNIEKSLRSRGDVSADRLIKMYQEAESELPEIVTRRLEEVQEFHTTLLTERARRLSAERENLKRELEELTRERKAKGKERDDLLKYLESHGALEEYHSLSKRLQDLQGKLTKVTQYQNLLASYKTKQSEIKIELEQENIQTREYLHTIKSILDRDNGIFRGFSKRLYEDHPGAIEMSNDEGQNKNRFRIKVKIDADASEGINMVKIFCFDMTLLIARNNHSIDFLFHDSCLFSPIDPRQRATLFEIASEESTRLGFQYIASINQDSLDAMKDVMGAEVFEQVINKNIVLALTDESPSSKLLGQTLDIDYEPGTYRVAPTNEETAEVLEEV